MKKIKLTLLVSIILILSTLLSACGNVASVKKYLNPDYDISEDVFTKIEEVTDLVGFTYIDGNGKLALLSKTDISGETTIRTFKVLSLLTGKVVLTLVNDKDTYFDIDLMYNIPSIYIKHTELNIDKLTSEFPALLTAFVSGVIGINDVIHEAGDDIAEITYELYDATGAQIAKTKQDTTPYMFADKLIFNYVMYDINDETYALTKAQDIPDYMIIEPCDDWNEDYYYVYDSSSIYVYDHSFNKVSSWYAPNYSDNSLDLLEPEFFILNNGDIFVQYGIILDDDAKKFDITYVEDDITYKVDLVSKIVDPKNGKEKDINVDYYVMDITNNNDVYDDTLEKEENKYTDKFENIARVIYIEDKKLMSAENEIDIVLMNNKAKIQRSIKIDDDQNSMAYKIAEDLFVTRTNDGGMIITNARGKIIKRVNSRLDHVGQYFYTTRAIYDLEFNKVYDMDEKLSEIEGVLGDTIFVREKTDSGYDIIAFRGGSQEKVFSSSENKSISIKQHYYVIEDTDTSTYTYYSATGEKLDAFKIDLNYLTESDDIVLVFGYDDAIQKYYILTK